MTEIKSPFETYRKSGTVEAFVYRSDNWRLTDLLALHNYLIYSGIECLLNIGDKESTPWQLHIYSPGYVCLQPDTVLLMTQTDDGLKFDVLDLKYFEENYE